MKHLLLATTLATALIACDDDAEQSASDTAATTVLDTSDASDATVSADTSATSSTDAASETTEAPDSVAPDSVAPDSVAPDSIAPDTSVAPDSSEGDTTVADIAPEVIDVDDCATNPCVHGTCADIGDGYECHCADGWDGALCDACAAGYEAQLDGGCARPFDCPTIVGATSVVNSNGCYFFLDTQATWLDAKADCEANGAELLAVRGLFEEVALDALDGNATWLGLVGSDTDGLAGTWDDGAPLTYDGTPSFIDLHDTGYGDYCMVTEQTEWYPDACDAQYAVACEIASCGDGHRDSNEACDDGNAIDGDGCDSNCTLPACGNLVVAPNEDCEPLISGDLCPADCQFACGHGSGASLALKDSTGCYLYYDEEVTWADATATCAAAGAELAIERTATIAGVLDAWLPGIGYWIGLDDRDSEGLFGWADGGTVSFTDWADGEPSADADADDCVVDIPNGWQDANCTEALASTMCTILTCGDHHTDANEECDDGDTIDGNGCDNNCRVTGCGNGLVDPNEDCELDDPRCPSDCKFTCGHGSGASAALLDSTGCWLYYERAQTFASASVTCGSAGGTLAVIKSGAAAHAVNTVSNGHEVWIGYTDASEEGSYLWVDGSTTTYTSWAASEPNNSGGDPGEDCAVSGSFAWNDVQCTNDKYFVCGIVTCGNHQTDPNETCDDGNQDDDDGCDSTCLATGCGSGVVTGDEECDDGDDIYGDFCSDICTLPCAQGSGASGARLVGDTCYALFDEQLDYADAEAKCEGIGGYVVAIDDAAENAVVASFGITPVFIGATDLVTEGAFEWSSGAPLTYTNWEHGEPNNGAGGEDCAEMTGSFGWNDINCAGLYRYICELPDSGPR